MGLKYQWIASSEVSKTDFGTGGPLKYAELCKTVREH